MCVYMLTRYHVCPMAKQQRDQLASLWELVPFAKYSTDRTAMTLLRPPLLVTIGAAVRTSKFEFRYRTRMHYSLAA